jgi:hypothetical protein
MTKYPKELVETLKKVFPDDVNEVRNLALEARLAEGDFPYNVPTTNQLWPKVVEEVARQGNLGLLARVAGRQPINPDYKDYFDRLASEITTQEYLVGAVKRSGFPLEELRKLYYKSLSDEMTPEEVFDAESMIFTLWGYSDRRALLRYLLLIAGRTENTVSRDEITRWYDDDLTPKILHMHRETLDNLRHDTNPQTRKSHIYLMVVVEPSQQDPPTKYPVSLYRCREGESPVNISARKYVQEEALEHDLIGKLEAALVEEVPLDETLYAIEFYLPSSLAAVIKPHLWIVLRKKVVRQWKVVISITERHFALNIAKMIQERRRGGRTDELKLKAAFQKLKKDARMYSLVQWARFWLERWRKLNMASEKLLSAIVGHVGHDEAASLAVLRDRLEREKEWACLALAFSPVKLDRAEFQALLDEALSVGMPIMVWTDEPSEPEPIGSFLPRDIFDRYRDKKIGGAADILELVHDFRTHPLDKSLADEHACEHLTIVLDNPEREIPQPLRTPK